MFIALISMATMGTKQTIDSNWDDGYEVKIKYLVPTNPKSKLDLGSKGSSPRFGICPAISLMSQYFIMTKVWMLCLSIGRRLYVPMTIYWVSRHLCGD